jgi:hypothetical protein
MSIGNMRSIPVRGLSIGVLSLCVALLGVAPPAQAAGGQVDLGGPDVSGYCQHLGFSGASFSAPPNQSWQCLHADGSSSPVNMQAACESSFSQRPILAKQLTPGVLLTWQCLQTSGGGVAGAQPTAAQLKSSLLGALRPSGGAAKIPVLKSKGSYPMRFRAPIAGSIRVSWSYLPKASGHGAKPRSVTVAVGRATISRAGTMSVKIVLTSAGRRLLKHASRIKMTAKGSFVAVGRAPVLAAQTFTLSR